MAKNEDKQKLSDIEDSIEYYEFSILDSPGYPYALLYHTNDVVMTERDKIENAGMSNVEKIKDLDKKLLRLLKKFDVSYKDWEQEGKELKRWWWHLDKIQEGTYPPELLPDYLKEEYFRLHPHLKQKQL